MREVTRGNFVTSLGGWHASGRGQTSVRGRTPHISKAKLIRTCHGQSSMVLRGTFFIHSPHRKRVGEELVARMNFWVHAKRKIARVVVIVVVDSDTPYRSQGDLTYFQWLGLHPVCYLPIDVVSGTTSSLFTLSCSRMSLP